MAPPDVDPPSRTLARALWVELCLDVVACLKALGDSAGLDAVLGNTLKVDSAGPGCCGMERLCRRLIEPLMRYHLANQSAYIATLLSASKYYLANCLQIYVL